MIRRPCTFSTLLVSFGNLYVSTNNLFHLRCWCIDKMFIIPFLLIFAAHVISFSNSVLFVLLSLPSFPLLNRLIYFWLKLFQKFVNNNFSKNQLWLFSAFYHITLFPISFKFVLFLLSVSFALIYLLCS